MRFRNCRKTQFRLNNVSDGAEIAVKNLQNYINVLKKGEL